jgi:nuclear transport factor 2 (NTF2) superfamily protein
MNTSTHQPLAPLPPFNKEDAIKKVRMAEDGWNNQIPEKIAIAYTVNSKWRNRSEFVNGRPQIVKLLEKKWQKEQDYRLIKELWPTQTIASQFVLPTNGMMKMATGFAPTAMRTGSLMKTV